MKPFDLGCALLILIPLTACSDDPAVDAKGKEAQQQLGEAWDALVDYGYARRDELARQMEDELAAAKVELGALKARASAASGEAKAALQQAATKLEQEIAGSEQTLAQLRAAAEDGWNEARDRAAKAFQALKGELDDVPE